MTQTYYLQPIRGDGEGLPIQVSDDMAEMIDLEIEAKEMRHRVVARYFALFARHIDKMIMGMGGDSA